MIGSAPGNSTDSTTDPATGSSPHQLVSCFSCGKPPGGGKFCTHCGTNQEQKEQVSSPVGRMFGGLAGIGGSSVNLKPPLKKETDGSKADHGHDKSFMNVFGLFSHDSDSHEDSGAKGGGEETPAETPETPGERSWSIPRTAAVSSRPQRLSREPTTPSGEVGNKRIVKSPGAGGWREHIRKAQENRVSLSEFTRSRSAPNSTSSASKVRSPRLASSGSGKALALAQGKDDENVRDRLKREKAERKAARAWRRKVKAEREKKTDAVAAADKGGEGASPTTNEGGAAPVAVDTSAPGTPAVLKWSGDVPGLSAQPPAANQINGSFSGPSNGASNGSSDEVVNGDSNGASNRVANGASTQRSVPDDEEAAQLQAMFANAELFRHDSNQAMLGSRPGPPQRKESQKWLDSESDSDDNGKGMPVVQLDSLASPKRPGLGERRDSKVFKTGLQHFNTVQRKVVRQDHPEMTLAQVGGELKKRWGLLSDAEKAAWNDRADSATTLPLNKSPSKAAQGWSKIKSPAGKLGSPKKPLSLKEMAKLKSTDPAEAMRKKGAGASAAPRFPDDDAVEALL